VPAFVLAERDISIDQRDTYLGHFGDTKILLPEQFVNRPCARRRQETALGIDSPIAAVLKAAGVSLALPFLDAMVPAGTALDGADSVVVSVAPRAVTVRNGSVHSQRGYDSHPAWRAADAVLTNAQPCQIDRRPQPVPPHPRSTVAIHHDGSQQRPARTNLDRLNASCRRRSNLQSGG
jgi:hypothetical protein